jgi:hypothetical protein
MSPLEETKTHEAHHDFAETHVLQSRQSPGIVLTLETLKSLEEVRVAGADSALPGKLLVSSFRESILTQSCSPCLRCGVGLIACQAGLGAVVGNKWLPLPSLPKSMQP